MKWLVLALALLLYGAAWAEQPELADEMLVLRWQRDVARAENALRIAAELERAAAASRDAILAKHKIEPGDEIDGETRVIKRAAKAKKDVKK